MAKKRDIIAVITNIAAMDDGCIDVRFSLFVDGSLQSENSKLIMPGRTPKYIILPYIRAVIQCVLKIIPKEVKAKHLQKLREELIGRSIKI